MELLDHLDEVKTDVENVLETVNEKVTALSALLKDAGKETVEKISADLKAEYLKVKEAAQKILEIETPQEDVPVDTVGDTPTDGTSADDSDTDEGNT